LLKNLVGLAHESSIWAAYLRPVSFQEKIYFFSPNFHESLFLLLQLQNRINYIPQLFKAWILSPWSGFEDSFAIVDGGFTAVTMILSFYFFIYFG